MRHRRHNCHRHTRHQGQRLGHLAPTWHTLFWYMLFQRRDRVLHAARRPWRIRHVTMARALGTLLLVVLASGCSSTVPNQPIIISSHSPTVNNAIHGPSGSPAGRITTVALAKDGLRAYAGTPRAGLWRSDDGGVTWKQLVWDQPGDAAPKCGPGTCSLPDLDINDVVVSPVNPNLVLAALGGDAYQPWRNGIYRSEDGGSHWKLVFQFTCLGQHLGADQIVFAPDDPSRLWAIGGCGVASSTPDAVHPGSAWTLTQMPGQALVYNMAIAPLDIPAKPNLRRVYACGLDDQTHMARMFYSLDGGKTFNQDVEALPLVGGCSAPTSRISSDTMVVDPSHPANLYIATQGYLRRAYYEYATINGAVGLTSVWHLQDNPPMPAPYSGSQFALTAQTTGTTTLLFYSDGNSLSVAPLHATTIPTDQPPPLGLQNDDLHSDDWHRLDGPMGQAPFYSDTYSAGPVIHVDLHALAVSSGFSLDLSAIITNVTPPPCNGGFLLVATDGGLFRSADCGENWQQVKGLETLAGDYIAGLPQGNHHAALYMPTYDTESWFSSDGGLTWSEQDYCGDCPPVYTDPTLGTVALVMVRTGYPYTMSNLYAAPGGVPDLANRDTPTLSVPIPYPPAVEAWRKAHPELLWPALDYGSYFLGYRPIVLTMPGEKSNPNGDYVIVAPSNPSTTAGADPALAIWRFKGQAGQFTPGVTPGTWANEGSVPSDGVVVQPTGGHTNPTYYVASRDSNDYFGRNLYRSVRDPKVNLVTGWDCIVPGPANPGVHDGKCKSPPANPSATDPPTRAMGFASDPYDAKLVYVADELGHIKRTADGGKTWTTDQALTKWMTADGHIGSGCTSDYYCAADWWRAPSVLEFSSMEFVPGEPNTRFALGAAGVFYTIDGTTWHRILSPDALACYPRHSFFDPSDLRSLYVACEGRSVLRFALIPKA